MRFRYSLVLFVIVLSIGFCTAETLNASSKVPQEISATIGEPNGVLSLQQAIALSLIKNPDLAAFSWEVRAQEAMEIQAGLIPNPVVDFTLEEFGGTGVTRGLDSAETTILVSQIIETAKKRSKRKNVAALGRSMAEWDYEAKRLDVFADTAKAFIDVLALQERVSLEAELAVLSEQISNTVTQRVEAGKVSPLEETKANVALTSNRIELERTRRELDAAKKRLAAFWASTLPTFTKVQGNLFDFEPPPDAERIRGMLLQNPDLARWVTEIKRRKAAVEMEKSKAVPDLTLGAGTQHFSEPGDTAFVVGLSIPLPVFDRNQGGIGEAVARLSKGYHENRSAEVRIRTAFAEACLSLAAEFEQASALKNEIVPGAQNAFDAATEGYRQGKFSYLDVLDAQRTFFEVRKQYIEVLADYHRTRADLDRLAGLKIEP